MFAESKLHSFAVAEVCHHFIYTYLSFTYEMHTKF